jgi:hypothetical protein
MNKRDYTILKKIQAYQQILANTVKEFNILSANDLDSIHFMMRRGMVQTVADIFELTVPVSDYILQKLPLNLPIIKQFRNTSTHNYGQVTNLLAYACITHCIDKKFVKAVKDLLKEPQEK